MEIQDYLTYLTDSIHTVTAAVIDNSNLPLTCALDIAACGENGIYFLVPKHTEFYKALTKRNYLSLTGIGKDSLGHPASLSLRGHVKEISDTQKQLAISPETSSHGALFLLSRATGEWKILTSEESPVTFSYDSKEKDSDTFFITDRCVLCRLCASRCPQKCIDISQKPARIIQENCIRCGTCWETCLAKAIIRKTAD